MTTRHNAYGRTRTVVFFLLAALAWLRGPARAQDVAEDWTATLLRNGSAQLYGAMVAVDTADHIFVTGWDPLASVIVTAKYDQAGAQLWQAEFDNPGTREAAAWLTLDPTGNVVIGGYNVAGSNNNPAGFVTLKYDPNGVLLWSRIVPNPRGLTLRVASDQVGNVFVLGRAWLTNSSGNTTDDMLLMKYSPAGTLLWSRAAGFDAFSADTPNAFAIDPTGNVFVTGGAVGFVVTVAYDASGNQLWLRTASASGGATDIALGFEGAVYVVGGTSVNLTPQMLVLKYTAAGSLTWSQTYPGIYARRTAVDSHGNVIVTGYASPLPGSGYVDWLTHKLDASGNLLWTQRYDRHRSNDEFPYALVLGPDDAAYVTGQGGPGIPNTSFLSTATVRYSTDGAEDWVAATTASVRGLGIARASDDSLAVVGQSPYVLFHYVQTPGPGGNLAPVAVASAVPTSGPAPLTVNFTAAGSFDPDGMIVSYLWDFGDLTTSTEPDPIHIYTTAVPYVATLVVTDDAGAQASAAVNITVTASLLPAAPTNLTATPRRLAGGGGTRVRTDLTWTDNATNETNYAVERCAGSTCINFATIAALRADATRHSDTGTTRGTTYRYRVRATNAAGSSAYSNVATATTP